MSGEWISATVHLIDGTTVSIPNRHRANEIAHAVISGRSIDLAWTEDTPAGPQRITLTVPGTSVAFLDQRWAS